jgi:hypothetical protein
MRKAPVADNVRAERLAKENRFLCAVLVEIRHQSGDVCAEFEKCDHPACRASYAAWSLADAALSGRPIPEIEARLRGH